MANVQLPTNYTDAVWEGNRKYRQITNSDGTVSFEDVTVYTNEPNSFFGAKDANQINEAINALADILLAYDGPGLHNSIYRGKNLGASVTEAQWKAIKAGTFKDLYIGDYWTINGVTWRIAAFDYYLHSGDTECTKHNVTIVPDDELYKAQMNTEHTTNGGYAGSAMRNNNLNRAKDMVNAAFGASHVLNHRRHLQNAQANGKPSGGTWYDSTVDLMTEQNVYGNKCFASVSDGSFIPNNYTPDNSQYPLFALRHDLVIDTSRAWYWLRDIVSDQMFANVANDGNSCYGGARGENGVRPAFSIA